MIREDITGDPTAPARAVDRGSPMLADPLRAIGFTTLAYEWVQHNAGARSPYYDAEATRDFVRTTLEGVVGELLVSPDGDAFCDPECVAGVHWLRFRTVLADGAMIETRRTLDGGPPLKKVTGSQAYDARVQARFGNITHETGGHSYPQRGYYAERLSGTAVDVWRRHQERVAAISGRRGSRPVDHRSFDLWCTTGDRCMAIRREAGALAEVSAIVPILTLFAAAMIAPIAARGWWGLLADVILFVPVVRALTCVLWWWPTHAGLWLASFLPHRLVRRLV